jgi:hypothetical protein
MTALIGLVAGEASGDLLGAHLLQSLHGRWPNLAAAGIGGPRMAAADAAFGRHHADAGGGDEDAVALALLDHLGVAGHHRHAGLARRRGHGFDDALQLGEREAFLEDEARAQGERRGAQHGHVVERAVHGQAADVAAGEEQRRDHVAVGGHHQAVAGGHRQQRSVVALEQVFVVEGGREQLLDQLRRGAAARAVVHVDAAVLEVDRADVVGLGHVHAATTAMSRNRP